MSCWCMGILGDCVVARKMKSGCESFGQLDGEGHFQDVVRPKHGKHCQIHKVIFVLWCSEYGLNKLGTQKYLYLLTEFVFLIVRLS